LWLDIGKHKNNLITTNYIIDETATLLRVKCGLPSALDFRERLNSGFKHISLRVLLRDEQAAWKWFEKDWSRLSFTDCTSFAVMKRFDLTSIAAFDDHFSRAGFRVVK